MSRTLLVCAVIVVLVCGTATNGQGTEPKLSEASRAVPVIRWRADSTRDLERWAKRVDQRAVRVKPVGEHPYIQHQTVVVTLPEQAPNEVPAEAISMYRLGYAIGFMESRNTELHCDPAYSEYPVGFMAGWAAGFQAETDSKSLAEHRKTDSATAPEPRTGAQPTTIDWSATRQARRVANEPNSTPEFTGNWELRLPGGFHYDVSLDRQADGLLALECQTAINLRGEFALTQNRLRLVSPKESGIDDFTWTLVDGSTFELTESTTRVGADYLGATLRRKASQL